MRVGTPGFVAARLTEVREARGFTQTVLSERTGIKPQSISHYEQGRQSPSPEALALLCTALDVPLPFFLRPAQAFSGPASIAERRLNWLKGIGAYIAAFVDLPPVRIPHFPLPAGAANEQIEGAAAETRRALGLGCRPITDLTAVLESAGCIVSPIRDALHPALSRWDDGIPWMLAGPCPWGAASELGSLVTNTRGNFFARAFVLPAEAFSADVWAPTLDALLTLRKQWNCPADMMIRRCSDLAIFNAEQTRRAQIKLARRGSGASGQTIKLEQPTLLARSIQLLLEGGVKDRHAILHDLALHPKDIEDLAGLPRGYLTEDPPIGVPELKLRAERQNFVGSIRQTL